MQDISLLAFRQSNEASCGVSALRYLLSLKVWPIVSHPDKIMPTEENLHTDYETGTEPSAICEFLDRKGIKWCITEGVPAEHLNLPAVVLYQWGGEGHYGVALKKVGRTTHVFNPYNAKIDKYVDFEKRWFDSPEVMWALTVKEVTCTGS